MNGPVYPSPLDPVLAIKVQALDADQREWFEERAAIREYMAEGVSRREAELGAWADAVRYFGLTDTSPRANDRR